MVFCSVKEEKEVKGTILDWGSMKKKKKETKKKEIQMSFTPGGGEGRRRHVLLKREGREKE